MVKKGGDFEILAIEFLAKIFTELNYSVVRKRPQTSGTQDGYDNLIEIVDSKYISHYIYCECKDYTTELNYTSAFTKIPQLYSTHEEIDLMLFISPKRNFTNIFEETRNKPFLEFLGNNKLKVAFLSPETFVNEYFSLYPELYRKIYPTNSLKISKSDRLKLLDKFDKFIFSSKNLSKIIISETDKNKFIRDIKKDYFHIERTIRYSQNRTFYYDRKAEKNTLEKAIGQTKLGLVLLGNPGYGKSHELVNLAINLWDSRDKKNLIPVFFILKNFSSDSNIESLLPINYKLIHNIILILDGVDEIENIIDFSNKLRNFISQNSEYIDKSKMKFLISCRTNVYKKFIKKISDFEVSFLDEINTSSSVQFLKDKYNLDIGKYKKFDIHQHRELLENPFYLDLIGKHFQNKKTLLTNKAKLIDKYVTSRLEYDKIKKYQNDVNFDTDKVASYTQKTAFALEAMQKPSLSSSEIKRVIKLEAKEFSKNPFLEENLDGSWSFVKKNIQEYFVSRLLQDLSFDEIINFVKIDSKTNKIHPTWYNVLTFLLNLELDKVKYDELINWLLANDFEILFNADSNRISDNIRSIVLQNFFNKKCIQDTLWINDAKGIASFSQSDANIDYLIENIKNVKIHRRARVSAVTLLSYMDVNSKYHFELKKLIIRILKENNPEEKEDIYLKQDVINLAGSLGLNNDIDFFNKIINILKDNDNKEIVSAIINSVPDKSIAPNIHYFLEILDKAIGIKRWNTKSGYMSIFSRKESIFNLFKRIDNPDTLLIIFSFLLDRHKNHNIKENLFKDFSKHIESILKDKENYHETLICIICDAIINDRIGYYQDEILVNLVQGCNIENQVFYTVLNKIKGNSISKHFLSFIVQENFYDEIANLYNKNLLNDDFIREFRNVISCRNLQLSKIFEKLIEENTNYRFKEKINIEEVNEKNEYWKIHHQKNFDVLFNIDEIINQVFKLFHFYKKKKLSLHDISKIYDKYYHDFEIQKQVTENSKNLFYNFLRDYHPENKSLDIKDVPHAIKSIQNDIIYKIIQNVPDENSNSNIIITEAQTEYLKSWCITKTDEANSYFKNHLFNHKSWNHQKYFLCEGIYKIQKRFNFNLDEELLLNMLWFNHQENSINLDYMIDFVSIDKINQRILVNLMNRQLDTNSFYNHIKYCIENNVSFEHLNIDIKSEIYLLTENNSYYANRLIEICYYEDPKTLKEFLNYKGQVNNKAIFIDNIISILIKTSEEKIVNEFIITNYSNLIKDNIYREIDLIKKLITTNNATVFEKLLSLYHYNIKNSVKEVFEFRSNESLKYTNNKALEDLFKIIEFCLTEPNIKDISGRHDDPLRFSCETIVNICKSNFIDTTIDSMKKVENMEKVLIENKKVDLFYFYKLKNDLQEIYIIHKSKPYQLNAVLKVLNDYKYLFIE
ncbi:NACHT domain-containing protein [Mariniflexile gromovii]|uniref:NACHT domain-containing protein n=1 Tax=Mariniflexile gromovii TaxID=362523 RepID=A0ABS4BSK7_9FLAO|nr:hypothetical protein [Mariniflexile gromovii]MBP0903563.1 hypothetical protein [Mariniflexile gromovii]